jgi:hypothetical protein
VDFKNYHRWVTSMFAICDGMMMMDDGRILHIGGCCNIGDCDNIRQTVS